MKNLFARYLIIILAGCVVMTFNYGCSKKIVKNDDNASTSDNGNDSTDPDDIEYLKGLSGAYKIIIAEGFTGRLVLKIDKGSFTGTIQFDNWGNGLPEPLKDIRINREKIYFIRSIQTQEELKKFGSTRFFKQHFFGKILENGKRIKGYFIDSGVETAWRADK